MRSRHSVENGSIQLVGDGVLTVYNSVENPKRCDKFSKRLLRKVKQERIYHKWNIAHKTIFCNPFLKMKSQISHKNFLI